MEKNKKKIITIVISIVIILSPKNDRKLIIINDNWINRFLKFRTLINP